MTLNEYCLEEGLDKDDLTKEEIDQIRIILKKREEEGKRKKRKETQAK